MSHPEGECFSLGQGDGATPRVKSHQIKGVLKWSAGCNKVAPACLAVRFQVGWEWLAGTDARIDC